MKEKTKQTLPIVALVAALAGPLFGYLEAREARKEAKAVQASTQEVDDEGAAAFLKTKELLESLSKDLEEVSGYAEAQSTRLDFLEKAMLQLMANRATKANRRETAARINEIIESPRLEKAPVITQQKMPESREATKIQYEKKGVNLKDF